MFINEASKSGKSRAGNPVKMSTGLTERGIRAIKASACPIENTERAVARVCLTDCMATASTMPLSHLITKAKQGARQVNQLQTGGVELVRVRGL